MYKEKLIELLKSCDEVKEAMEKLEFGCKVYNEQTDTFWLVTWADWMDFNWTEDNYEHCISHYSIIWLPIQERFIRMYCRNKAKYFIVYWNWDISFKSNTVLLRLDDTKDFDNQSEETYMDIFNALISIK